jgi:hypothetical protein
MHAELGGLRRLCPHLISLAAQQLLQQLHLGLHRAQPEAQAAGLLPQHVRQARSEWTQQLLLGSSSSSN